MAKFTDVFQEIMAHPYMDLKIELDGFFSASNGFRDYFFAVGLNELTHEDAVKKSIEQLNKLLESRIKNDQIRN